MDQALAVGAKRLCIIMDQIVKSRAPFWCAAGLSLETSDPARKIQRL
jgi:hypothetical protein